MTRDRAIRIGNWYVTSTKKDTWVTKLTNGYSSGAGSDGPDQMYRQATEGPIDAIYSDYLAEVNLATKALEVSPRKAY